MFTDVHWGYGILTHGHITAMTAYFMGYEFWVGNPFDRVVCDGMVAWPALAFFGQDSQR